MRIVCDACATKYSIADDKVSGKVFKIRCKKCSNVIVVKGTEAAPPVEEPPPPPDGIWHLVIDDDQVGPLSEDEIRARIGRGEVTRDTFAWCEGLAEWAPLAQLDVFAALFAEPAAPADDIFAVAAAAPVAVVETPPQGGRLLAERNESSVLFSMNNLARLAGPAPAKATAVDPGAPVQEGSGLIDIRSMASAYRGTATATPAKGSAGIGSLDDLPVFAASNFSEPAVLVPTVVRTSNRLLHVMIAAVALLAVIAIVLVVVLLKGHDEPAKLALATPPPAEPAPPVATPPPAPIATLQAPAPVETPAPTAPAPREHAAPAPHSQAAPPPPPHPPAPRAPKLEQHAAAPAPPAASEECDEIKCIVNSDLPCCHKHAAPKAKLEDASLPERLASSMITASLDPVRPKVMACGASIKGKVRIHVKVGGDGKVSEATPAESPDPALGACAAAAVKRATFPKTQNGGSFYVPYLF